MSLDHNKPGIGSTAEFMASSWPWVTSSVAPAVGSPVKLTFQNVSKTIVVSNTSNTATDTLSFGFTIAGVISSSNKFVVKAGQSISIDVKTKFLFLQGESGTPNYSVFAGLTGISADQMPVLTGSIWDGVG